MGSVASEALRFPVHHLDEPRDGTADVLADCVGRFVTRLKHDTVERLFERDLLTLNETHTAARLRNIIVGGIRNGNNLAQIRIFERDESREDLRRTRGIESVIDILFIQDAQITDMDDLAGILSKYILTGMTKGSVWAEGVYNGVLYLVVKKMDELCKFWGQESNR